MSFPYHPHPLTQNFNTSEEWACDARHLPGGCGRGFMGATRGLPRYRCVRGCDYDVCGDCITKVGHAGHHESGHHHVLHSFSSASHPFHSAMQAAMQDLDTLFARLSHNEPEKVSSPLHPHPLVHVPPTGANATLDWACDGRTHPKGCGKGFGGENKGKDRYNCASCNFDLCHDCIRISEPWPAASPSSHASSHGHAPATVPSHRPHRPAPPPPPASVAHIFPSSDAPPPEAVGAGRKRALIIGIKWVLKSVPSSASVYLEMFIFLEILIYKDVYF